MGSGISSEERRSSGLSRNNAFLSSFRTKNTGKQKRSGIYRQYEAATEAHICRKLETISLKEKFCRGRREENNFEAQ